MIFQTRWFQAGFKNPRVHSQVLCNKWIDCLNHRVNTTLSSFDVVVTVVARDTVIL